MIRSIFWVKPLFPGPLAVATQISVACDIYSSPQLLEGGHVGVNHAHLRSNSRVIEGHRACWEADLLGILDDSSGDAVIRPLVKELQAVVISFLNTQRRFGKLY